MPKASVQDLRNGEPDFGFELWLRRLNACGRGKLAVARSCGVEDIPSAAFELGLLADVDPLWQCSQSSLSARKWQACNSGMQR